MIALVVHKHTIDAYWYKNISPKHKNILLKQKDLFLASFARPIKLQYTFISLISTLRHKIQLNRSPFNPLSV